MLQLDRILALVDTSGASDAALARAVDLARRTGAELHVLHVVPGFEPVDPDAEADPEARAFVRGVWATAEEEVAALLERIGTDGARVRRVLAYGLPSAVALDYAARKGADLIVTGTHGRRGLRRAVLGSVAGEVLHRATVPVLVVPQGARSAPFFHVLAPTDFSPASRLALPVATAVAGAYGAALTLLHAVEPLPWAAHAAGLGTMADLLPTYLPEARSAASRELAHLVECGEGALRGAACHVVEGRAAEAIAAFARAHGADLVVLGKHGYHGVERLLMGSVTERVCRLAPTAVLAVPVDEADVRALLDAESRRADLRRAEPHAA